jgi:NitT/TauT family transport system permease protein
MIASSLILPPPGEVAAALWRLILSTPFWRAVLGTFSRVAAAFVLSIVAGSATGAASGLSAAVRDFLAPLLTTIRATPVLALILVAMFWLPASGVPVFTAFLMAYPVMHTSVYSGIAETDKELLEMAAVFKVPAKVRFFRLRLPSAETHFLAGAKNALGMCWKVVVAGEVLSQPARALGTGLQDSRLSLDTAGVLAWAAATVLLCGVTEFALGTAARASARRRKGGAA